MIIDFHTHVFPEKIAKSTIDALASKSQNKPHTDGTVEGMLNALEDADAQIAVTLPVLTKPTQFDSVVKFASYVNENYSRGERKLISFAGMHPACDDIAGKMEHIKSLGIKGVKIHPDYQATFIDDKGYIEILKNAKKFDLIVVTHAGVDEGYKGHPVMCPPERVLRVIEEVGHEKFVLAHYGGHKQWQKVYDLLAGTNVYFDTAHCLTEIDVDMFKSILSKHGHDKVLFATDCPWSNIKEDAKTLQSFGLGVDVEEKLLYKNALKLLNIGE